jgi:hypothetical protein
MTFLIRFLETGEREKLGRAEICIGEFRELFEVDLSYWSKAEYELQWRLGLERILEDKPRSCLITSLSTPETADFILWWPLYALDGEVAIQNQLLFLRELAGTFDPQDPYDWLGPRETNSPRGAISEWRTTKGAIAEFLRGIG